VREQLLDKRRLIATRSWTVETPCANPPPRASAVHLDALLDLLHVLDLDAEARLLGAVGHPHLLGLLGGEFLEFGDDFFGDHLFPSSSCM
jgi:hypothetical protein